MMTRRQVRRSPALLVLSGSILLASLPARADDGGGPKVEAPAVAAPQQPAADKAPADKVMLGKAAADQPVAAAPDSGKEVGRSTATVGQPYGSLVPVQVMPRVHPAEPALGGAFLAPEPSSGGALPSFSRSALAVPHGFEPRPAPQGDALPSQAVVPSLASPSIAAPSGSEPEAARAPSAPAPTAPATQAGLLSSPVGPAPGMPKPPEGDASRPGVPAPVAPEGGRGDAAPADAERSRTAAPAADKAVRATEVPTKPPVRAAAAPRPRPAASAQPSRHAIERTPRVEKVHRETARALVKREPRRDGRERYDDLPELTPLPPGVVPTAPR